MIGRTSTEFWVGNSRVYLIILSNYLSTYIHPPSLTNAIQSCLYRLFIKTSVFSNIIAQSLGRHETARCFPSGQQFELRNCLLRDIVEAID